MSFSTRTRYSTRTSLQPSFSRETVTVRRTESVRERNTVDSFGRTTRTVNYSGLDADTKAKVDSILDQFMTR